MTKRGNRPNILLICADMISAKFFGCYGDTSDVTPNIDRLAETGIRFDSAYCPCPPCIPARVSMMSGQYAHTHGKTAHIKMELNPRPPLIPEILSKHGYKTALVGKTHWWPPDDNLGCKEAHITIDNHLTPELGNKDAYIQFLRNKGVFDYNAKTWEKDSHLLAPDNLPVDCLKVNWTGDKACSLVEKLSKNDNPFFLFCSFVEPHAGGNVPKEHMKKFRDIFLRPIIAREKEHETKHELQRKYIEQIKGTFWGKMDPYEYRRRVYASVNMVDNNVGKIIDKLESLNLRENTVVFFLTDHGDLMFDHGCVEKTILYEGAIRIPLLVNGPAIPRSEVRQHLVSQIDLLPTVLELSGIEIDGLSIDGRSMVPIIENPDNPWRNKLFCEVGHTHVHAYSSSMLKMVRTGPWKYIYSLMDGHIVEEELYNLDDDPDELYNLAHHASRQKQVVKLRSEILRWLVATEVNRLHPVKENTYSVPYIERCFF